MTKFIFCTLLVLAAAYPAAAQEKPTVFVTDDFYIRERFWFENPKGVLDELSPHLDAEAEEIARSFAKNCDCLITSKPGEADYVLIISWHDLKYGAKLAPKRYVLLKSDDDQLVSKGSVRRVKNIISDSCKAIQKERTKST
jgi:hypothetical protein